MLSLIDKYNYVKKVIILKLIASKLLHHQVYCKSMRDMF